jgi:hypothetical protein
MAGPAGRAGADVLSSRGFLADESGVGDRGLVADGMLAMFSSEVCEWVDVIISDDPFFTMLLWTTSGKERRTGRVRMLSDFLAGAVLVRQRVHVIIQTQIATTRDRISVASCETDRPFAINNPAI